VDTSDRIGQYVLVRTGGFYAAAIRFGCREGRGWRSWIGRRSRFDHVAVVTGPAGQIVEAEPGGARRANLSEYDGYEIRFSCDPLTDLQREQIVRKALWYADERVPYGWLDILGLSLRCLGLNWRWLTSAAEHEDAAVCSQLAVACAEFAAYDEWMCGRLYAADVTPAMLDERLG
jgi:hypothetical protein